MTMMMIMIMYTSSSYRPTECVYKQLFNNIRRHTQIGISLEWKRNTHEKKPADKKMSKLSRLVSPNLQANDCETNGRCKKCGIIHTNQTQHKPPHRAKNLQNFKVITEQLGVCENWKSIILKTVQLVFRKVADFECPKRHIYKARVATKSLQGATRRGH